MTDMAKVIILLTILDFFFFILISGSTEDFWFNPKYNYEKWYELNWFGVGVLTILYWIAFLPITIILLIGWLFTVGRK